MQSYQVVFDPDAQEEALGAAEYIAQSSPANAAKWFAGLEKAIDSLRTLPNRCGLARESQTLGVELRHYIYDSHRKRPKPMFCEKHPSQRHPRFPHQHRAERLRRRGLSTR